MDGPARRKNRAAGAKDGAGVEDTVGGFGMGVKSKAFLGIAVLIVFFGMGIKRYIYCSGIEHCQFWGEKEELKPGDYRLHGLLRYFDVIAIDAKIGTAHINPPSGHFSVIPTEVKFTDEDFMRMTRKIFEEEFHKKFGDDGVIFAKESDSYTFETNPYMVKLEFSLQENEKGESFVQVDRFRTHWATLFPEVYMTQNLDSDIRSYKGRQMEQDIFKIETRSGNGRFITSFRASRNQNEFMLQIESSAKSAFSNFLEEAKPEPEIARKYSAMLLKSLKANP